MQSPVLLMGNAVKWTTIEIGVKRMIEPGLGDVTVLGAIEDDAGQ